MEQVGYNPVFRWFVGLSVDDSVCGALAFSKDRDRLLGTDVAQEFLSTLLLLPRVKRLLSNNHFFGGRDVVEGLGGMKSSDSVPNDDEETAVAK